MSKTEKLKEWLSFYGFDVDVKKDTDFSYYSIDECIHWTTNKTEHDNYYLEFIRKLGCINNLDIKTFSFLHELGHHELWDSYTIFDLFVERFKKYVEKECKDEKELKLMSNLYYRFPVEYKATKWMINFVEFFTDEARELDQIFKGK